MYFTKKYKNYLVLSLILLFNGCISHSTNPCDYYCPCTDGKISANNIAYWSGGQWIPLGSGVNGFVERIIPDSVSNELYVFGRFTEAGGIPVNGQAKWSEKTQSWSAIGTQLPRILPSDVAPIIVPLNGHIFVCNQTPYKLYNPDSTFFDKNGLYEWDGNQWKSRLDLKKNQYDKVSSIVLGSIGNILYIAAQINPSDNYEPKKIYLFDLLTSKVIDSITESATEFIFSSSYDFKFCLVTNDGIFIDEGEGVYNYQNAKLKKIININTSGHYDASQLTANSEYVCLWNPYTPYSTQTKLKNMVVYDINADTIFNEPSIPFDTSQHLVRVMASKIIGHSLFIGGQFYLKDGSADVRNIGAYDLRQKKWYDLAGGVCGPVNAITEMNGSMYVGGEFSTVGKK